MNYDPYQPVQFPDMDKPAWAQQLDAVNYQRKATPWLLADMLLYGQEHFCNTRDDILSLYDEIAEQLEMNKHTLQNYASCARSFPASRRRPPLTIAHHIAVLGLDVPEQEVLLDRASEQAWSAARLRAEAHVRRESYAAQEQPQKEIVDFFANCAAPIRIESSKRAVWVTSQGTIIVESDSPLRWRMR